MTLVMVWREESLDRLWIVSDSRLSRGGQGGGVVRLTDRGAKLLEAPVLLRGPNPQAPPIKSRMVGFAYTGSSLVALQSYAAVLPLWARLHSSGEQNLPTIGDCANHLGQFVRAYVHEVAGSGDMGCKTECVLLGFNDATDRVEAWRAVAHPTSDGVELSVAQIEIGAGGMALFGSGSDDAREGLEKIKPAGGAWRREPMDFIRKQLRDDAPGSVGGGVQIGLVVRDGFELCSDARPFRAGMSRAGDPLLAMQYRGFELGDVGRVGHTFASLAGVNI